MNSLRSVHQLRTPKRIGPPLMSPQRPSMVPAEANPPKTQGRPLETAHSLPGGRYQSAFRRLGISAPEQGGYYRASDGPLLPDSPPPAMSPVGQAPTPEVAHMNAPLAAARGR